MSDLSEDGILDLIKETNSFANAFLTEIVVEKLEQSKTKLFGNGKNLLIKLLEVSTEYVNRLKILKSLRVGIVHKTNNYLENDDLEDHIEMLEKTIQDLDRTFSQNIRSDLSKVITKDEFEYILANSKKIQDICRIFDASLKSINTKEADGQKNEISSLKKTIDKIHQDLTQSQLEIDNLQCSVIRDYSKKFADETQSF